MNLTMCKKVCKECPFSENSAPGWLGEHTVEEVQESIQFERLFSCHLQRTEFADINQEEMESGVQNICRGFVISASKSCKRFGQNPSNGEELLKLQQRISKKEHEGILNKWDFKKHHQQ